jgi:hypothetical protein
MKAAQSGKLMVERVSAVHKLAIIGATMLCLSALATSPALSRGGASFHAAQGFRGDVRLGTPHLRLHRIGRARAMRRRYYDAGYGYGWPVDAVAAAPAEIDEPQLRRQAPRLDERLDERGLPYNSSRGICFWQREKEGFARVCK